MVDPPSHVVRGSLACWTAADRYELLLTHNPHQNQQRGGLYETTSVPNAGHRDATIPEESSFGLNDPNLARSGLNTIVSW